MDVNVAKWVAQESSEKTCNKYVSQYVKCANRDGVGDGDGDGFSGRETVSVPLGTIKNAHY